MSPWRKELYGHLDHVALSGRVLDLGGDARSGYHELFRGEHTIETVNLEEKAKPDHMFDLEQKFPLPDTVYDAVLCMNIMEHIFRYREFLSECKRVLKSGGKIVLAVPFVMQVHPSPHDYFRYSEETLERIFTEAGFSDIVVRAIGCGPFTAASQIVHNPLSKVPFLASFHELVCRGLDLLLSQIDRKGTFSASRYPLGYVVEARRA